MCVRVVKAILTVRTECFPTKFKHKNREQPNWHSLINSSALKSRYLIKLYNKYGIAKKKKKKKIGFELVMQLGGLFSSAVVVVVAAAMPERCQWMKMWSHLAIATSQHTQMHTRTHTHIHSTHAS